MISMKKTEVLSLEKNEKSPFKIKNALVYPHTFADVSSSFLYNISVRSAAYHPVKRLRSLSQLGRVAVWLRTRELQQPGDDPKRTRHVPLGKRTLGRVPDRSREDVLRAKL